VTVRAPLWMVFVAAVTAIASGCATSQKTARRPAGPPAQLQTATKEQLITSYNEQASAIRSVNATISMKLTAGTAYSGVIKQYHEVKGFILAQKPASIRVIGQAPIVGTNIFDMASDGEAFQVYIPSKNKFLEGPANLERESAQPIENLRPQHLTEAFFWTPIPADSPVLWEAGDESEARYYILTIVRNREGSGAAARAGDEKVEWEIDRKVWFDRADLSVARLQVYDAGGNVTSDVRYGQWDSFGSVRFARQIELTRPAEDYALQIGISKLSANEPVSADKFKLKQPEGAELVHVGEETKEPKP
jgi:outer membrane lipoprotein-sorting protein